MLSVHERERLQHERDDIANRIEALQRAYATLEAEYALTEDDGTHRNMELLDADIKRMQDEVSLIENELGWDEWSV